MLTSQQSQQPQQKVTTSQLLTEIAQTPFSFWTFSLLYIIYQLVLMAQQIEIKGQDMATTLVTSCAVIENSTNYILSFQSSLPLTVASDLTAAVNNVTVDIKQALDSLVTVGPELFDLVINFETSTYRCPTIAVLQMATGLVVNNQAQIDSVINGQLTASGADVNTVLAGVNTDVDGAFLAVNNVLMEIQNILDMPVALASFTATPVSVSQVSFPTASASTGTSWTAPDYTSLYNQLLTMIDPLTYLQSQITAISFNTISTQQVLAALDMSNISNTQVSFCSQLDTEQVKQVTAEVVTAVYGLTALVATVIVALFAAETLSILNKHKRLSPYYFCCLCPLRTDCSLVLAEYCKYIWHKPSMMCLLVGLVGITVFKALEIGVEVAQQRYIATVLTPIQVYEDYELTKLDSQLLNISTTFASTINGDISQMQAKLTFAQQQINSTVTQFIDFQTTAKNLLTANVDTTLANMIECMTVFLNISLVELYSLVPNPNFFPLVADDILTFNKSHVEFVINSALNSTTYPFDYYYSKFDSELGIYYFLVVYGSITPLVSTFYFIIKHHCHGDIDSVSDGNGDGRV